MPRHKAGRHRCAPLSSTPGDPCSGSAGLPCTAWCTAWCSWCAGTDLWPSPLAQGWDNHTVLVMRQAHPSPRLTPHPPAHLQGAFVRSVHPPPEAGQSPQHACLECEARVLLRGCRCTCSRTHACSGGVCLQHGGDLCMSEQQNMTPPPHSAWMWAPALWHA